MSRRLAALLIAAGATVLLVLVAGGGGAKAAPATPPALSTVTAQPVAQPPGHDHTPLPVYTIPPELLQTAQPAPVVQATVAPTPTPLPTAVPTTGPAVGTQVTPPGLTGDLAANLGPTPQPSGQDPTLVVLVVIIGLGLLAIGAFVLAISVQ